MDQSYTATDVKRMAATIVSVRPSTICFPVGTHSVTIVFSDGTSTTKTMNGKDISSLLVSSGLHTAECPHERWEHLQKCSGKRDVDATMRSCSYNKERPIRHQVTKLKANEKKRKKELLLKMFEKKKITESDMNRQMIADEIKTEDGRYIDWTVAPRSKALTFTTQFRVIPFNKLNKKRQRARKKRTGAYELQLENAVAKAALPGGPPPSYLVLFSKCIMVRFPSGSTNLGWPACLFSTYETGQVGVAGASDDVTALLAVCMMSYAHSTVMKKIVPVREFGMVNFTTSGSIGMPIDLDGLVRAYKRFPDRTAEYDPEAIDAVQIKYRPKRGETRKGKAAMNVYATGGLVVVGFVRRADIAAYKSEVDRVRAIAMEQKAERDAAEKKSTGTPSASGSGPIATATDTKMPPSPSAPASAAAAPPIKETETKTAPETEMFYVTTTEDGDESEDSENDDEGGEDDDDDEDEDEIEAAGLESDLDHASARPTKRIRV